LRSVEVVIRARAGELELEALTLQGVTRGGTIAGLLLIVVAVAVLVFGGRRR
jgi:hypothetical protein